MILLFSAVRSVFITIYGFNTINIKNSRRSTKKKKKKNFFHEIPGHIFLGGRKKKKIDRLFLNYVFFNNIILGKLKYYGVFAKLNYIYIINLLYYYLINQF